MFGHSAVSDSLRPHGLQPIRLLCPWNSLGKNTGVGSHFLLPGIFLIQGSNLHLLQWQADSLPLRHHQESSFLVAQRVKNPPAVQETRVQPLGWEDLLEKEMATLATHSSILA